MNKFKYYLCNGREVDKHCVKWLARYVGHDVALDAVTESTSYNCKLCHHGLTDLHDNYLTCFTDMLYSSEEFLPWFQATYQASLKSCPRAKLTIKLCDSKS